MTILNLKGRRALISFVLALLCLSAVVCLAVPGGIIFGEEYVKVLNYAETMCLVISKGTTPYPCVTDDYNSVCYKPVWRVIHSNNKDISATVDRDDKGYSYQINSSYTCWYDTRKSYVAQWNEPNARDGIIVLSCGGLALLLTILFFYLSYRFSMQKRRQIARDNFMSIYTVRAVTN